MSTWAPGRVASFAAGEWMVMVTNTGDVRIWSSDPPWLPNFTLLEVVAFDLRWAIRMVNAGPLPVRKAAWTIEGVPDGLFFLYSPGGKEELQFWAKTQSVVMLYEGLGKALDAIHRHHGRSLADFEAQFEREHGCTL